MYDMGEGRQSKVWERGKGQRVNGPRYGKGGEGGERMTCSRSSPASVPRCVSVF